MGLISNGTTLLDAGAIDSGVPTGSMVLIKTLTASGSSTLSFVDGASSVVLDNTYKQYIFKFINIHPSGTNRFQFNGSSDSGSNYNVTKTTTIFTSQHSESGAETASLLYQGGDDLAQGTGFQDLMAYGNQDADNDHSLNGTLHLFDPSDTTFAKNFFASSQGNIDTNYSNNGFIAGYFNTTSAIDAIRFQMTSGTFDGIIKLYGIK
tara:strand:+ start:649 stop:1269 length:621 start_codon:yes stop_codon:yes gene_type:complete